MVKCLEGPNEVAAIHAIVELYVSLGCVRKKVIYKGTAICLVKTNSRFWH